ITPNTLNTRIKELREAGLVSHGGDGYSLTVSGQDLLKRLSDLQAFAGKWQLGQIKKAAAPTTAATAPPSSLPPPSPSSASSPSAPSSSPTAPPSSSSPSAPSSTPPLDTGN
ncbi:MAG: transcriptional regulator, partial [Ramlibacter sp.]